MRIGRRRIELARILTEITGFSYLPSGIKQTNRAVDIHKLVNYDAYYWYALPEKHGAVLASPHTMKQIINARKNGKTIECENGAVSIKDNY